MSDFSSAEKQTNLLYSVKFWALTVLLILLYSSVIIGQNPTPPDPENSGDPDADGSCADMTNIKDTVNVTIDSIRFLLGETYFDPPELIMDINPGKTNLTVSIYQFANVQT